MTVDCATLSALQDEILLLREEAIALTTRVNALQRRLSACASPTAPRTHAIEPQQLALAVTLRAAQREQQLSFAAAQAALSGFAVRPSVCKLVGPLTRLTVRWFAEQTGEPSNPLHTPIRLGTDLLERRRALLSMRDQKLSSALAYVQTRLQWLDPLKPYVSEERFETARGDYCCTRFDVTQFRGVESVQQVFDSIMFYVLNVEISVWDQLGCISVRDDLDRVGTGMAHAHLVSTQCDLDTETNVVTFAECQGASDGVPSAVFAIDSVEDDALHPYKPHERLRKDVSQAIVLTPYMRTKAAKDGAMDTPSEQQRRSDGDGSTSSESSSGSESDTNGDDNRDNDKELVVVMTRVVFLTLRRAAFAVPPRKLQRLRESMGWSPVMLTTLNELLYPPSSAPVAREAGHE